MALTVTQRQQMQEIQNKSFSSLPKTNNLPPIAEAIQKARDTSTTAFERIRQNLGERTANLKSADAGTGQFAGKGLVERRSAMAAEAAGAVSSSVFEVLPEKARDVLGKVGDFVGGGVSDLVEKLSDTQVFREAAASGETAKLEEILSIVSNTGAVAGEAAGVAETGLLSRAVASKAKNLTSKGIRAISDSNISNPVAQATRKLFRDASPDDLVGQQDQLVKNLRESVVRDKKAVNNKLTKAAGFSDTTPDGLLRELVEEGGLPNIKGNKADFTDLLSSTNTENKALSSAINTRVSSMTQMTPLDDFFKASLAKVRTARAVGSNLNKIEADLARKFNSLRNKYGDNLTADNINEMRVEANKAFKEMTQPEIDANKSIGDVARGYLNDFDPDVTQALNQQSKLFRVQRTANALNLESIAVNEFVEKLGGLTGTVGLGAIAGTTAVLGGPGSLIIAAMFANIGSKVIATQLRKKAFSPKTFKLIKQSLNENPDILDTLLRSASKEDRSLLENRLLPAGNKGGPRQQTIGAEVIEIPSKLQSQIDAQNLSVAKKEALKREIQAAIANSQDPQKLLPAASGKPTGVPIEIPPRGAVPRGLGNEPGIQSFNNRS